ncbi:MAG TPA: ATP-binding protein [Pyrinomonadaceae bacterium]|nr:ATP-binding protein [Pyrinomonadaceae bacterium]
MSEEKQTAEQSAVEGEVVYRRVRAPAGDAEQPGGGQGRRSAAPDRKFSPTLMPLLVGFALLLTVIAVLGRISVSRLDQVSTDILNLERGYAGKLSILLELRMALTNLNNEARARGRVEGEPEPVIPMPFGLRIRRARGEVERVLPRFEHLPLAQTDAGRAFRRDLDAYISVTEDNERYSLEGFEKFRTVDAALNSMLRDATGPEQEAILHQIESIESRAARSIRLWSMIALLTGTLVAAGTIWDVQRRFRQLRRSMSEAQRERHFSAQMLEGMVSALAAVDAHDRIRSANAAFFKIFPKATIGASVYDRFAPPGAMKMLEAATATRVAEATYRGRWLCPEEDPDCANRAYDVYSSPLAIDGEQGQLVTLVDVTEASEAEANLRRTESLAAVGQAAAQLAHEIKNPLGSIRLGVSMLRDSMSEKEGLNTIDLVERGIDHLNKLVVDVTNFSGQKALERSEVNLHSLLETSLELVADRINEKRTPVEKHYGQGQFRIEGDEDQLRQVFVNILANAVDASPAGSPVIVSTARVESGARQDGKGNGNLGEARHQPVARVTIDDRGTGMNEATQARIFEPFFTTKKRGTGLGLAIVKQIIERHNGTINVASTPGQGTRFTIDLPLKSSDK